MKNLLYEFVFMKHHYEDLYNEYEKEKDDLKNLCQGIELESFINRLT